MFAIPVFIGRIVISQQREVFDPVIPRVTINMVQLSGGDRSIMFPPHQMLLKAISSAILFPGITFRGFNKLIAASHLHIPLIEVREGN